MYLYFFLEYYLYANTLLLRRKDLFYLKLGQACDAYINDTNDTTALLFYHFLPSAFNASDLYCELGSRYGFSPIDDALSPALSSL